MQMAVVLEKTQNDDRLIAALKNEVASLKRQQGSGAQAAAPIGVSGPIPARGYIRGEHWGVRQEASSSISRAMYRPRVSSHPNSAYNTLLCGESSAEG